MPKSASVGESLSELKQRRGSLQVLNVDLPEEEDTAATKRKSDHAKQLRDQSNMMSTVFQSLFILRGLARLLFPGLKNLAAKLRQESHVTAGKISQLGNGTVNQAINVPNLLVA